MAVTSTPYLTSIKNQHDGTSVIDFDTDTIKCALLTNAYTPDTDAHDFFNDVSGNEVSGTGYTAGGATLATPTITKDTANNKVKFDAADTSWTNSTITARYAVVYKSTGTASTSPLIALVDFGADQSTSGSDFNIVWHSNGIVEWAAV